MKQILTLLFILIALGASSQIENTSARGMNLKGQVKEIVETTYNDHNNGPGNIYETKTFHFTDNGLLMWIESVHPDESGYRHELFYENGIIIKDVVYDLEGAKAINNHTYENGLRVKTTHKSYSEEDPEGPAATTMHTLYTYNNLGQLIKEVLMSGDEEIEVDEYTYNEEGKLESRTWSEYGNTSTKKIYSYDGNKTITQIIDYDYEVSTDGEMIFDKHGNMIYNGEDFFSTEYKYIYDDQNNWIEKKDYSIYEGEPSEGYLITREITYYP